MKTTSVIQRLLLLASVPLIALAISIGTQTRQSYVDYRNSEQTLRLMDLSASAGNLIHTLQVERGATAGFLQSKGQKFADVLPGIRTRTDERLAAFRLEIDKSDSAALPSLVKATTEVQSRLKELAAIRQ
nr:nitrate- and nitrite sensing domain-containing protein [Propionivibrio sp.]